MVAEICKNVVQQPANTSYPLNMSSHLIHPKQFLTLSVQTILAFPLHNVCQYPLTDELVDSCSQHQVIFLDEKRPSNSEILSLTQNSTLITFTSGHSPHLQFTS